VADTATVRLGIGPAGAEDELAAVLEAVVAAAEVDAAFELEPAVDFELELQPEITKVPAAARIASSRKRT